MTATTVRAHGTRTKYVHDHCRCLPCRAANANYATHRDRQIAYGRRSLVDAASARAHLLALRQAGIGTRRAAELAKLTRNTVIEIATGETKRIHPENLAAVLAVQVDHAPNSPVDGTGTRRRLRALVAIGWSQARIAAEIGWTPANFTSLIRKDASVSRRTADAVREVYGRLWNAEPPAGSSQALGGVNRARRYAAAEGWAVPMAWDDDTIDDPAAVPFADTVARTRGVDLDEVAHLEAGGVATWEIAFRLGVTESAIDQARFRARRAS